MTIKEIKFRVVIGGNEYVRTTDRFVLVSNGGGGSVSYKVQIDDSMFAKCECPPFGKKTLFLAEKDVRCKLIGGFFDGDVVTFTCDSRNIGGTVTANETYGFVYIATDDGLMYPLHMVENVKVIGNTLMGTKPPAEIENLPKKDTFEKPKMALTAYVAGADDKYGNVGAGYLLVDDSSQTVMHTHQSDGKFTSVYDANIVEILGAVKQAAAMGATSLVVRSCCQPVIYGITTWSKTWIANGWKKKSGEDIKYADIWKALLSCIEEKEKQMDITFHWISKDNTDTWDQKSEKVAKKQFAS